MLSAIGPEPLIDLGLTPYAMQAIELEKFSAQRWLAKRARVQSPAIDDLPQEIQVYAPMTAQMTSQVGHASAKSTVGS
jgi:hypothetical protein